MKQPKKLVSRLLNSLTHDPFFNHYTLVGQPFPSCQQVSSARETGSLAWIRSLVSGLFVPEVLSPQ